MSDIILNHPALLFSEDVATICRPLLRLGISYFAHVNVTKEGKFSGISNNPGFAEHYLRNKYYNADIHLAGSKKLAKYIIWDLIERTGQSEKMHIEASQFGVQHTFTMVEKKKNSSDFYHFASQHSSPAINHVYLANMDLLKNFIEFFKGSICASVTLSNAYRLTFCIDKAAPGYTVKSNEYFLNDFNNRLEFINEIQKHDVNKPRPALSLPPQQLRCMQLLVEGHSAKKIADILNLSTRTVENYLAHIRKSLKCSNSKQLIIAYHSLFL